MEGETSSLAIGWWSARGENWLLTGDDVTTPGLATLATGAQERDQSFKGRETYTPHLCGQKSPEQEV